MLSKSLKASIRELWNHFWAGGIANPLTAIEQITYLVFLKRLEDLDDKRVQEDKAAGRPFNSIYAGEKGETYRWSYIRRLPSEERLAHVRDSVFRWLRTLPDAGDRMQDAVFVIPSANLLQRAIEIIDRLFVTSRNEDTIGDIYEMLLSEIAEAGKNGQFRTPRHIIRAMCDLVDPQFGEKIFDPACGTGGFLINAYQHILKNNTSRESLIFEADGTALNLYGDKLSAEQFTELRRNHLYGFDIDRTMIRLGWMNMKLHGLEDPQVQYADALGSHFYAKIEQEDVGNYNVALANPPFTGNIDKTDIGKGLQSLGTTKTELLFVDLILDLLQIGGRAAVIVPEGVLFGSTSAHKKLRKKLITENQLDAVISLPGGVFQPYTGVKTSILVFNKGDSTLNKGDSTKEVWFYELAADGYTLNAKRDEKPETNDLWDMLLKYCLKFKRSDPSFVDPDTWNILQDLPPEKRSLSYAQPYFRDELFEVEDNPSEQVSLFNEPETEKAKVFAGLEITDLPEAKDWSISLERLESSDYRLDAGFYKPQSTNITHYDPPQQIIGELLEIEDRIKEGLNRLLKMVEGVE